ncbi:MAG: BhlA/UviB family holin-like peptide [Eubacteriales bacterium]|nr:BhlA/UviB family holin-like peptide [Eubacteriales bacterium]
MESTVLNAALSQGIWAVLAVFLLIYVVKSNERFEKKQEEREKQYQELLSALTEKFNILSDIEKDISEVKNYILKE